MTTEGMKLGPRMVDGNFISNRGQTWRRCCVCGHHAMILPTMSVCPTCDGE